MKSLVVYESMFGNTAEIGRAVADGLTGFDVTLADVHDMPPVDGTDLLVVGAPTHAFGLSRPATRADAAKQGAIRPGAENRDLREYLDDASPQAGVAAAAFDTRSACGSYPQRPGRNHTTGSPPPSGSANRPIAPSRTVVNH